MDAHPIDAINNLASSQKPTLPRGVAKPPPALGPRQAAIIEALRGGPFSIEALLAQLARSEADRLLVRQAMQRLVAQGRIQMAATRGRKRAGSMVALVEAEG